MSPDQAISVRGERNAFWDLVLAPSPAAMVAEADELAAGLIHQVQEAGAAPGDYQPSQEQLRAELAALDESQTPFDSEATVEDLGRALRIRLRIHVVARQILGRVTGASSAQDITGVP